MNNRNFLAKRLTNNADRGRRVNRETMPWVWWTFFLCLGPTLFGLTAPARAFDISPATESLLVDAATYENSAQFTSQELALLEVLVSLSRFQSAESSSQLERLAAQTPPASTFKSTERLALCALSIPTELGDGCLVELLSRQNSDGGWGYYDHHESDVLSTSLALRALVAGDLDASAPVSFLLSSQASDGSYALPNNDGDIHVTSQVLLALQAGPVTADAKSAREAAASYVVEIIKESPSSAIVDHLLPLYALTVVLTDRAVIEAEVNAISDLEQSDGTLEGDVYLTALAIRLEQEWAAFPRNAAVISGTVLDAARALALAGVTVTADGREVKTEADGSFLIVLPEARDVQLSFSRDGYRTLTYTVGVYATERLALDNLFLQPQVDEPADMVAAYIQGSVTDLRSGDPIGDARVEVSGAQDGLRSDNQGLFAIQLPPEADVFSKSLITIRADGYLDQTVLIDPVAGGVFYVDARLLQAPDGEAQVRGVVASAEDDTPLAGTTIRLFDRYREFTTTTDEYGRYSFNSVTSGDITMVASRDGYATLSHSSLLEVDELSFDFFIQPEAEAAVMQVNGKTIAESSREPVAGASVLLRNGMTDQSTSLSTTESGNFDLSVAERGEYSLFIQAEGYLTRHFTLQLNGGSLGLGEIVLSPSIAQPMLPDDGQVVPSLGQASISLSSATGRVVDVDTKQPVEDVSVQYTLLRGTEPLTKEVLVDNEGVFALESLPAAGYLFRFLVEGYEDVHFGITIAPGSKHDFGTIYLKQRKNAEPPLNFSLSDLDTSSITYEQGSLDIGGEASVTVTVQGNQSQNATPRLVAFEDINLDGQYNQGDTTLGEIRTQLPSAQSALTKQSVTVPIALSGHLSFHQAPISFLLDPAQESGDSDPFDNLLTTASECVRPAAEPIVDLFLCVDTSNSIEPQDLALEISAVASAVEGGIAIRQDGSVRLALAFFSSSTQLAVSPTIISAENAASVAEAIRSATFSRSGTAIHACIDLAVEELNGLAVPSARQAISISTDGESNLRAMQGSSEKARLAGIDAITAIAVGTGPDIEALESVSFQEDFVTSPKVVPVEDFSGYALAFNAATDALSRSADLTVGAMSFATEADPGMGLANFIVGNRGAADAEPFSWIIKYQTATQTVFEQRSTLETALITGQSEPVEINSLPIPEAGVSFISVEIEPHPDRVDCTLTNNKQRIPYADGRVKVDLTTAEPELAPGDTLDLIAKVVNLAPAATPYLVRTQIWDYGGVLIHSFDSIDAEPLDINSAATFEWQYAEQLLLGNYLAETKVFGPDSLELDSSVAPFVVKEPLDNALRAVVRTDKVQYVLGEEVYVTALIRNLSTLTRVQDLRGILRVTGPDDMVLLDDDVAILELVPNSEIQQERILSLPEDAGHGIYQAELVVFGEGMGELANAKTRFELTAPTLQGKPNYSASVQVDAEENLLDASCSARIEGDEALADVQLSLVRDDAESLWAARFTGDDAMLPFSASRKIDLRSLESGMYMCQLSVLEGGQWSPVARDGFSLGECIRFEYDCDWSTGCVSLCAARAFNRTY